MSDKLLTQQLKVAYIAGAKSCDRIGSTYRVQGHIYLKVEDAADAYIEHVFGGVNEWKNWVAKARQIMQRNYGYRASDVPVDLYQAQHSQGRTPDEAVTAIMRAANATKARP